MFEEEHLTKWGRAIAAARSSQKCSLNSAHEAQVLRCLRTGSTASPIRKSNAIASDHRLREPQQNPSAMMRQMAAVDAAERRGQISPMVGDTTRKNPSPPAEKMAEPAQDELVSQVV